MCGMRATCRIWLVVVLLAIAFEGPRDIAAGFEDEPLPSPPNQPTSGPGGSGYTFRNVQADHFGTGATGYWIFAPRDVPTDTDSLPLVLFFHGFSAVDPNVYRAWIDHIVLRGAVVVYPDYQTLELDQLNPETYFPNALTGIESAVARLERPEYPSVDLDRVAAVGHSVGGVLTANYSAVAGALGLPVPVAMMPVEPGGCQGCGGSTAGVPFAKLELVPATTLALVLVGSDDTVVGDSGAETIWAETSQIPNERRDFIELVSDDHGDPALVADHFQPSAADMGGEVDSLDWYGTWKLFDALTACAFEDSFCETAIGNTPEQRDMGTWTDGVPVTPLRVTDDPSGR